VSESPLSVKPVSIKGSGKSYIRLYDGDYELSIQEEQMLIANRGPSRFDEETLSDSGIDDLDEQLVQAYIAKRKEHSTRLAQFDDTVALFHTGVTDKTDD
jgi:ATP-dependent DNA helicase RecG